MCNVRDIMKIGIFFLATVSVYIVFVTCCWFRSSNDPLQFQDEAKGLLKLSRGSVS